MTTQPDVADCAPTFDEIRDAVDRITASDVFCRSPQLGAFLRFVVEAVLHGKAERIKAYTIGVEVLRRDTNFDPQLDPIVRVEATRLRRSIERYYAGNGSEDSVIIDLPRGSYVPTFRRREPAPPPRARILELVTRWATQPLRPTLACAIAALAVLLLAVPIALSVYGSLRLSPSTVSITLPRAGTLDGVALPPGNGMPTVAIEPFQVLGAPLPTGTTPDRLYTKLRDAFARFDTINVAESRQTQTAGGDSSAVTPAFDYRLSGAMDYTDGLVNIWFTLTDNADGTLVWSRNFSHIVLGSGESASEDTIVISVTNSLLQSYGVIRSRDRAKQMTSNSGDPRYRCILTAADAIRTADRPTHDIARACLEQLTALDPSFAVGFTFLALIYNREFQYGYKPRVSDPPPLDLALRAVRTSVNLQPESSRGYLALMVVQFNRRDVPAAMAAGERCLKLNKYDMLALGEFGGRLVLTGDVERGMQMLREAGAGGAIRPAWHYIYLFVGSYVGGDRTAAAGYARQFTDSNVALGQVAQALAAKFEGDPVRAQKALDRLIEIQPNWRDDPRGELSRLIIDPGIVDRLYQDLAAAGLPGRS